MSYHVESIAYGEITLELIEGWKDLVLKSSDANPFYEPWALIPALEYFATDQTRLLCVWKDKQKSVLIGLFPLERFYRFRSLPLSHMRLWKHEYCYLCTPLVCENELKTTLVALLGYLKSNVQLPRFTSLNWLPTSSLFSSAIVGHATPHVLKSSSNIVERASVDLTDKTYDEYLLSLNKRKRKEWSRQWRRFCELGSVNVEVLSGGSPVDSFSSAVEAFIVLEHSGWKAERGTSLFASASGAAYFRAMMIAGHAVSQTLLLRIMLDNRPVGMLAAAISADQKNIYTMKIATDPGLGKFSLGSQIILQLTQWLLTQRGYQYADSCAAEDHPMINWLWHEKLQLGSVYAPNGDLLASAAINVTDIIKPRLKRHSTPHV